MQLNKLSTALCWLNDFKVNQSLYQKWSKLSNRKHVLYKNGIVHVCVYFRYLGEGQLIFWSSFHPHAFFEKKKISKWLFYFWVWLTPIEKKIIKNYLPLVFHFLAKSVCTDHFQSYVIVFPVNFCRHCMIDRWTNSVGSIYSSRDIGGGGKKKKKENGEAIF